MTEIFGRIFFLQNCFQPVIARYGIRFIFQIYNRNSTLETCNSNFVVNFDGVTFELFLKIKPT